MSNYRKKLCLPYRIQAWTVEKYRSGGLFSVRKNTICGQTGVCTHDLKLNMVSHYRETLLEKGFWYMHTSDIIR